MIEIKHKKSGVVLHTHTHDADTLSYVDLSYANLSGANLSYADLRGADLRMTNLSRADLSMTNLSRANLRLANLRLADLREANLRGADLRGADLRGADLRGADLREAVGNMREVVSLQIDNWLITMTKEVIAIGCQQHPVSFWESADDTTISEMDRRALAWWKVWKPCVLGIHDTKWPKE